MRDLVIVGSGGFAREVGFLVEDINKESPAWNLVGYVHDGSENIGTPCGKSAIIGTTREFIENLTQGINVVIGIGAPAVIWRVSQQLAALSHVKFPNLIHPSVVRDRERVSLGHGNIVCAGNVFTTDIKLGSFNILNLACTLGHDIVMGDCNVVNPGVNISGGVVIGNRCLVGTGATILQNKKIGDDATVGGGAVVVKDVEGRTVVAGVPARLLRRIDEP